jgi:predicted dithiol-disulfide oxidoreductase (DUF899 family)
MGTIGTREEHEQARAALLEREKEHMRQGDELARERRELPWVSVEQEYVFQTASGEQTLEELFEGRSQLLVYHFMFTPEDEAGCTGCSFLSDHLDGPMPHVNARDITLKVISRGDLADLQAYRERMGWQFDWVSSAPSTFNRDFGATTDRGEAPGVSAFVLEDGVVYHTYSTWSRGCEMLDGAYHLIDLSPLGRQEEGLDQPGSWWWRRHDEYEGAVA